MINVNIYWDSRPRIIEIYDEEVNTQDLYDDLQEISSRLEHIADDVLVEFDEFDSETLILKNAQIKFPDCGEKVVRKIIGNKLRAVDGMGGAIPPILKTPNIQVECQSR